MTTYQEICEREHVELMEAREKLERLSIENARLRLKIELAKPDMDYSLVIHISKLMDDVANLEFLLEGARKEIDEAHQVILEMEESLEWISKTEMHPPIKYRSEKTLTKHADYLARIKK